MEFHTTQREVVTNNSQFRVVNCGRQWGKTTLAVWEMLGCAYAQSGRSVRYYATTFDQARDIAWASLKTITRPIWAKEPNESRLELTVRTQDKGESKISLEGWESVERARGQQFDFLVLDEVSKMRNFKTGWEGALMGTLVYRNGKTLFLSTPNGFDHFYELWELGQGHHPLYKSWKFTSLDNPFLNREYLENVRQTVTQEFWGQEYMADFLRFTGLIYKEFNYTTHVHEFEFAYGQHGDYYFAIDFAVRGWTASVVALVRPDGHIYILDEYKKDADTAQNHSENIKEMLKKYNTTDKFTGYADPAGFAKNQQKGDMIWAIADEYLESGLGIIPANNEVLGGINFVRQLFIANKIHIHPRCKNLIDEIMQYQWKDQSSKQVGTLEAPEKVRKINDHLVDAMRYVCYSKPTAPEELEPPPGLIFPAEFKLKIDEPNESQDHFEPIESPTPFDI